MYISKELYLSEVKGSSSNFCIIFDLKTLVWYNSKTEHFYPKSSLFFICKKVFLKNGHSWFFKVFWYLKILFKLIPVYAPFLNDPFTPRLGDELVINLFILIDKGQLWRK